MTWTSTGRSAAEVEERLEPLGAADVRDLVRVGDDGGRAVRGGEAREDGRGRHRRLDVDVGVPEGRGEEGALQVDLVLGAGRAVGAEAEDPVSRDADRLLVDLARQDVDDAGVPEDEVGGDRAAGGVDEGGEGELSERPWEPPAGSLDRDGAGGEDRRGGLLARKPETRAADSRRMRTHRKEDSPCPSARNCCRVLSAGPSWPPPTPRRRRRSTPASSAGLPSTRPRPAGRTRSCSCAGLDVAACRTLSEKEKAQGIPSYFMTYISTASADASAAKAAELGGAVLFGPFDVEGIGRMAVVRDPGGVVFALWEARGHIGARLVGEENTLCWTELVTKDADGAKAFYSGLFGWTLKASEERPRRIPRDPPRRSRRSAGSSR